MINQYIDEGNWLGQLRIVSAYREQKHEQGTITRP